MRGQVYAFLGGLVWDMFWISQRESEVIAPKRRREGERESEAQRGSMRECVFVSPKVDFVHVCQLKIYLTVLKSIFKSDS